MLRDEGGIDDRRGGSRGRDGDGDDGLRDEEPVLSDGGDEGGDAHRVGRLCNGQGSLHAQLNLTKLIQRDCWSVSLAGKDRRVALLN